MVEPLPVPEGLETKVERLRKGWKRPYAIRIGLVVLVVVPLEIFLFTLLPTHHGHREHPHWVIGLIFGLIVAALVIAGYVVFVRRLFRRYRGSLAPLALALPFRQRRQMAKAVRAGRPSADPLLRYLETRAARLATIQSKRSVRWSLPVLVVILGGGAAISWQGDRRLAIFELVVLLCFLALMPLTIRTYRGAQRYLRAVGIDPDEDYRNRKQQPAPVER